MCSGFLRFLIGISLVVLSFTFEGFLRRWITIKLISKADTNQRGFEYQTGVCKSL